MNWEFLKQAFFPSDPQTYWTTLFFCFLMAALAGLELLFPRFQDKPHRYQRWPTNLSLGLINFSLVPIAPVSALLAAQWAHSHKLGLLNLLDDSWWIFAAAATISIWSFVSYVTHFLLHKIPLLWRMHRVHHFDTKVDVTTALRSHPLEFFFILFVGVVSALVFGLTPWALIAYETVHIFFDLFAHANIKFPAYLDRILRFVIVTPRLHAVHHSSSPDETDSNYGTVLTVWDRIFRTYCDPQTDHSTAPPFGLADLRDHRTSDLWWQLKSPGVNLERAE